MKEITFKYADAMSNWEWKTQHCVVDSLAECIKMYGLNDVGVEYQIIKIKEVDNNE